jgi:hypothetical protein
MGARGPVKRLGTEFPLRLNPDLRDELQVLCALEGTSIASMIRTLLREALETRKDMGNASQASR